MNHKKIKMVIAGLGGRGHDIYSNYGLEHPDEMEVVAIADPRPDRLKLHRKNGIFQKNAAMQLPKNSSHRKKWQMPR